MATTNTIQYDNKTGRKLLPGETTSYGGQTVTQGQDLSSIIPIGTLNNAGTKLTFPTTPTSTYGGLTGAMEGQSAYNKSQADLVASANEVKTSSSKVLDDLYASLGVVNNELGTVSSSADRTEQDAAQKKSNEYTSLLEQEQLANRRTIERLQKENPQGLFGGGLEQEVNRLNRESLSKQADIAILQTAANRNYETASQIADRQVKMKLEALTTKAKNLEMFIDKNQNIFDKADERAFNLAYDKVKQELKTKTELENSIKEIKLEAAKNGADVSILTSLSEIDTSSPDSFNEALKIARPYMIDTQIVKLDNGNTVMIDSTGKVIKNLGGAKANVNGGNNFVVTNDVLKNTYGNDVVGLIAKTINSTGAKQNQSTNDAINVISGLQQLVKDSPEGVFKGLAPIRLLPNKAKSPEALTNLSNIEAINLKVQQWASGASLTEQQTKSVNKITPKKSDTDAQVRAKVNALANYMVSQVSGQLAGQGVGFSIDKIDLFTKTPEQELKELYKDPEIKQKIIQATQTFPNYTDAEILQIVR